MRARKSKKIGGLFLIKESQNHFRQEIKRGRYENFDYIFVIFYKRYKFSRNNKIKILDYIQKESKPFILEFDDGDVKPIQPPYRVERHTPSGLISRSSSYYLFSFLDAKGVLQIREITVDFGWATGEEGFGYKGPDSKFYHVDKLKDSNGNVLFPPEKKCEYLVPPDVIVSKNTSGKKEGICFSSKLSSNCSVNGKVIDTVSCRAILQNDKFSCPAVKNCAEDQSLELTKALSVKYEEQSNGSNVDQQKGTRGQ